MVTLTSLLPEIEAAARTRDILTALGCTDRGCRMDSHDDWIRGGRWVKHNDKRRFFKDSIGGESIIVLRRGSPEPAAYIPRDIVDWIVAQHPAIDLARESERQAAVVADPWRLNAAMVSLSEW